MNKITDIKKIESRDSYNIIYSDKEYYVKNVSYNIRKNIDYFNEIGFSYYGELVSDKELIYCIDSECIGKINGEELIKVLKSLQEKSCIEREYNDEEKNELYNKIHSTIDDRMKYYLSIQDIIDDYDFPPPAYYLLVKNISKFYKLLKYAFSKLDEWFNNSNNKYREVFLIEDVSFDNFYVEEKSFFLDYGSGNRGNIVYDFEKFYRKELFYVDMNYLFNMYCDVLNDYDILLLLCLISIPDEISFIDDSFIDTISVRRIVDYVDYTFHFLEKYKKDKETDKDKFKEKNNDIDFSSDKDQN